MSKYESMKSKYENVHFLKPFNVIMVIYVICRHTICGIILHIHTQFVQYFLQFLALSLQFANPNNINNDQDRHRYKNDDDSNHADDYDRVVTWWRWWRWWRRVIYVAHDTINVANANLL